MKTATPKKRVIRKRKDANSPSPTGGSASCGPCGHSHCGDQCRVRYIGATTHIRDHHILHTARGVAHIWTAVIIAGLALVLTGAIAYNVAQAHEQQADQALTIQSTNQILQKIDHLEERINTMERDIEGLFRAQQAPVGRSVTPDEVFPTPAQ